MFEKIYKQNRQELIFLSAETQNNPLVFFRMRSNLCLLRYLCQPLFASFLWVDEIHNTLGERRRSQLNMSALQSYTYIIAIF